MNKEKTLTVSVFLAKSTLSIEQKIVRKPKKSIIVELKELKNISSFVLNSVANIKRHAKRV